jgi:hypothetical protein
MIGKIGLIYVTILPFSTATDLLPPILKVYNTDTKIKAAATVKVI